MITIATDDLQLGHNDTINEEQQIQQYQFDSPPDDFEFVPAAVDDPLLQLQQEESINKEELQQEAVQEESINKEELQQEAVQDEPINKTSKKKNEEFTHEENKLLLTLLGITLGSIIIWTLR